MILKSTNGQVTGKFQWTFWKPGIILKKNRCDFAVGYNDVENHMKASCLDTEILFLPLQFCRNCIWNTVLPSWKEKTRKGTVEGVAKKEVKKDQINGSEILINNK